MTSDAVILTLNQASLATARQVQSALPGARVLGLAGRVEGADTTYTDFGPTLRELFAANRPLVVLCAAGIVIRALAPMLGNKRAEPPVLALAEDGSAVVPLLGGLAGVNHLARTIGTALGTAPAITTSGEIRFRLALETPPEGYVLRNPTAAKGFMSDLLAGRGLKVVGAAPWLDDAPVTRDAAGPLTLTVTADDLEPGTDHLVYHPRVVVAAVTDPGPDLPQRLAAGLAEAGLAAQSLALILAPLAAPAAGLAAAARAFGCPLRRLETDDPAAMLAQAVDGPVRHADGLALARAETPDQVRHPGLRPGRLAVVGLGPGDAAHTTPAVKEELRQAEHLIGYQTYLDMAGPFAAHQQVHGSDNRVELDRAAHAFQLAAEGHRVVVVSSGDPGIFAMAAAVLEALENNPDPRWLAVDLVVLPGITAAQAAAAKAGAPLGHDFATLSLSDNLKPFRTILERLELAARADLALALYNPISKARPWQLGQALDLLRTIRAPETTVILGRDIGRPAEHLTTTTLGELTPEMVDMRTVVLIGSTTTHTIPQTPLTYTPRWYPGD
ncbi:precorrin-3B C(17)-methyltransferase [Roseospirillum parvum]|uniref:Cobalt-precorrin 5A hydrolase / precorrin-3B C17-methyltransferase n=1 Tax=Roseospirillum parvum TaxID=83401 RepID=A0A1G8ATS7_9PROT|nr:precorrin-3B C(17)-methyltransferase [Roseospirillum parvum]SDH24369.1 cobalt-precorrin 5A hydrolase / precorrin-3B C17-methyltransferase [Roseospirillum parvum]